MLGRAESLSIRVNGLVEKIGLMRSELFRNVLTKRYALTDAFGGELLDDVHHEYTNFYRAVSSWLKFVVQFKFQSVLAAAFFALVAAAVLLFGGRRLFGRVIEADPTVEEPSYLSRLSVAFWSTLLPTLALGAFLARDAVFLQLLQRIARRYRDISHVAVRRHRHRLLRQPAGQRRTRAEAAELAADLDRFEHCAPPRGACRRRWRL